MRKPNLKTFVSVHSVPSQAHSPQLQWGVDCQPLCVCVCHYWGLWSVSPTVCWGSDLAFAKNLTEEICKQIYYWCIRSLHSYLEWNEDPGYLRVWLWYRFLWVFSNCDRRCYLKQCKHGHSGSDLLTLLQGEEGIRPVCSQAVQASLSYFSCLPLVMLIKSWHLLWVSTQINSTW